MEQSYGNHVAPDKASRDVQPKTRRSRVWNVIFWVALGVFIASAVVLGVIAYSYWAASDRYSQLSESFDPGDGSLEDMTVDWATLQTINPEVIGWVYIPGTVVNYPIVQTSDNDKYLNTNFDGQTGLATGCGTIFLDKGNAADFSDQNNVIYGHHRNDGSMFAVLSDFADQSTFDAHRNVYVLTPSMNYRLSTFSLIRTTGTDPLVELNFANAEAMGAYIQDKIDRSLVTPSEGKIDASSVKRLFTFSTCDYNESNGRAVLFSTVAETAVPRNSADYVVGTYTPATE